MRRACAAILLLAASAASAHTLSGVVRDPNDVVVSDARVWLTVARTPSVTLTDDSGKFSFPNVPTGSVQLVVLKDGFALGGASGQCIDDTEINLKLVPPTATQLRVINTRYEPVEGASLARLELPGVFNVFVQDLASLDFPAALSDAKGFLALPPLPRDAFINVSIGHPGYADGVLPALPAGEDIDFPLPDGVPLAGRITDNAGAGVAHARVSVYRPGETSGTILVTETLTDADGFYSTRVPAGKYFVAAQHPRHAMPLPKAVMADTITGDAVLNLALPAPHRLHGRALDEKNAPVPLAVFAYRTNEYFVAETVSDAQGGFEMLVPAGEGALHVYPPRRMTSEAPRIYLKVGDAPDIEIESVRFRGLPELHGKVDTRDGASPGEVLITSLNLDSPLVAVPDATGNFTLSLDTVPDEPLRFRAEHALRFQRRDFEIDPAKLDVPEIRLRDFKPEPPKIDGRWPNELLSLVDKPAPELVCRAWLNLPEGQTALKLADLRGKVVVLFLWTGFDRTPRAIQRLSEMMAAHQLYKNTPDVAIVSVHDAAVPPDAVVAYVKELNVRFPVGHDVDASDTFTAYHTGYVPQTVFIDKKGMVRFYTGEEKLLEVIKILRRE